MIIQTMKKKLNRLLSKLFGFKIARSNETLTEPVIIKDTYFQKIYSEIKPYTMTSMLKCYALYQSVKYIVESEIPGDFVECGVWKGGNAILIAKLLKDLNVIDRKIYLYDTFSGMVEPTDEDKVIGHEKKNSYKIWSTSKKSSHNEWCYASLEEVKKNVSMVNYPKENFIFVKGEVEKTIPKKIPQQISLLRLDTDWYESTKHELTHLFPLLTNSGILIVDDYGHWEGQKKAVDEYFRKKPLLLNRIDRGGRIAVKTY